MPTRRWKLRLRADRVPLMSTVAEIESAISHLTPEEVDPIAVWLDEYRRMIRASAEVFSLYDAEEKAP